MAESVDVLVLGAGPAGSTIARLLAERDYSVLLLKGPPARYSPAGSLPPSISSLFESLGISGEIEEAGFYPDRGVTRWWDAAEPLVENYAADSHGYHVERNCFDSLLMSLAERAGALVRRNSRAPRVALEVGAVEHDGGVSSARFVVDATGRAGLLARQIKRYWDPRYSTAALCGFLRANTPWDVNPHHNLIEAYDRGWAWSVPVAPDRRYVSFMVDASTVRGGGDAAFRAELERTLQFRRLFADSELDGPAWSRDASLYYADQFAGANWMLVGDAGSFVDLLTSSGVEKAMMSAWRGAETVSACLENPGSAEAAVAQFNAVERSTWLDHARRASRLSERTVEVFDTPFWRDRATPPQPW